MTAVEMSAELFRQLSIIAEDESLMAKMLKYAKKLTASKADPTLMTKEEFFAKIDESGIKIPHQVPKRITLLLMNLKEGSMP